jgi:predicted ATPase/transcriptional regulator with XRE-family HTH domain
METLDLPGSFGDWLKARRKALDLTQEELAGRAGCSVFALRKIETGERRPSKQLAGLLAAALEVPDADRPAFVRVARGERSPERMGPASPGPSAARASTSPGAYQLPLALTPLLGREAELAAIERLFKDPQCRLLTLTGMGGIGKTRLALEFASRQRSAFSGGVYYAPLASVNSTEMIVPVIADVLGFSFSGPADPKEQLIDHLAARLNESMLLVLDNLEHLLAPPSGTTKLVAEMLRRIPRLKILATSRERLNLQGEWMYELHGLPVPPTAYATALDQYSATALFVHSARRIRMAFEIDEAEGPAVARICQLLEGIPLAIELAAAWVGMLSCAEIAAEIESNIDFLQTTMRDIPERHRSLRASFEHSWRLLSGQERAGLCRLAVFRGGFDRAAAAQVAGAELPLLASLVSKSLVRRGDDGRYDLHEVIRQFAHAHLETNEEARDAHSRYFLQFAAEREMALRSTPQPRAMREILDEMDNLRAAWIWAIRRGQFVLLGRSVRSFGWFFEATGLLREGIEQFEPLVRVLKARPPDDGARWVLGFTLTQQALLYFRRGWFNDAQARFEESLAILRSLDRKDLMTDALVYLGIMAHLGGDLERSRALMEEGQACAQVSGDDWFEAYAIYNLGYIDSLNGRNREGSSQMRQGLSIWRRIGDPHYMALGLNYLAPTLVEMGCFDEAETALQESLRLCQEHGNRWGMGTAYRHLGSLKMAQGRLEEAQELLRRSLETFGDYIVGWDLACSSNFLAEAVRLSGDLAGARQMFRQALRLSREAGSMPLVLDALAGLAAIGLQDGRHEQAFAVAGFVLDHRASTQKTRGRCAQIHSEAGGYLGADRGRSVLARSGPQTLDAILEIVE